MTYVKAGKRPLLSLGIVFSLVNFAKTKNSSPVDNGSYVGIFCSDQRIKLFFERGGNVHVSIPDTLCAPSPPPPPQHTHTPPPPSFI